MLQLQLGPAAAQLDLRATRVLLGRDPATCGLATGDPSVSRRHAEVFLDGGNAYIRDLGSSNGTWVNGQAVGQVPILLQPGQQVFVGHQPLRVEWRGVGGGATMVGELPPHLKAMMEQRRVASMGAPAAPMVAPPLAPGAPPAPGPTQMPAPVSGGLGLGGRAGPTPAEYTYRKQGSNSNGVLLIALRGDTFSNGNTIDGFLEFTALDGETVASITVELVEVHRRGASGGHVWDRMLVRQGPWRANRNEVVPMPFQLRIPPGTSMSGRDVNWEVRGLVDIDWAFDVDATSPITMRNVDVEKLRDALGALDYRVGEIESEALGQSYSGKFQPPAQLQSQLGISDVNLSIEYLGTNLKVVLEVEKTSLFRFDKQSEMVFDLTQFRAATAQQLSAHLQQQIAAMMAK